MSRKILSRLRRKSYHGYTFIELILYVSIVIIIMSALIPFALTVIGSGAKSRIEQEVFSQARYVSERIKYEIRNANSINSLTATSLDLNTAVNPTTVIDSLNGKIRIRYGSSGTPVNLNANNTAVSGLTFTNHTSADNKTRNIQFNFTIDDSGGSIRQDFSVPAVTIEGAAELRSPFIAAASPTVSSSPIPGWSFRKRITILETKIPGTTNLANFTILISITDTDLAADAQNTGNDILFTAADGITKLDHEIESFNGTTGNLAAWIRIPTLTAAANTAIYMYYGNPAAANQQNVTGTWNSNYKGVWHLNDASNATRLDSTSNNNDLADVNANTSMVTGQINNGANFIGSAALGISDAAQTGLDITGPITLESWFKLNDLSATTDIAAKNGADPQHSYHIRFNNSLARFNMVLSYDGTTNNSINSNTTGLTTGAWYHGVGVYNGSNMSLYLNGITDGTTAYSSGIFNSSAYFCIGGRGDTCNTQDFIGVIDEVRVSNVARSTDWITTEYNNQSSPSTFYTIGAEEAF